MKIKNEVKNPAEVSNEKRGKNDYKDSQDDA